jgi:hypothetical protein
MKINIYNNINIQMTTKREALNQLLTNAEEYINSQNIPNLPNLSQIRETVTLEQIAGLYNKFLKPIAHDPEVLKLYIEREIKLYSLIYNGGEFADYQITEAQLAQMVEYIQSFGKIISA